MESEGSCDRGDDLTNEPVELHLYDQPCSANGEGGQDESALIRRCPTRLRFSLPGDTKTPRASTGNPLVLFQAPAIWGLEFREELIGVAHTIRSIPGAQLVLASASISHGDVGFIERCYGIQMDTTISELYIRGNVTYTIVEVSTLPGGKKSVPKFHSSFSDVINFINERFPNGSVILFSENKKRVNELAAGLNGAGMPAVRFHSDLLPNLKAAYLDSWSAGEVRVMVATSAISLGVDNAHCIGTVHFGHPSTVYNFIQESGRVDHERDEIDPEVGGQPAAKGGGLARLPERGQRRAFLRPDEEADEGHADVRGPVYPPSKRRRVSSYGNPLIPPSNNGMFSPPWKMDILGYDILEPNLQFPNPEIRRLPYRHGVNPLIINAFIPIPDDDHPPFE
ncbi:unnamed protein product [Bemisia tabaci]|uniref:DNA 3'-5' helicase n=1 Tax=Bemisia tabaci TaxID=7038 RepID=A0A9P0A4K8_BEMTA|nr:unnamed protein product [Bemisia tabaci]